MTPSRDEVLRMAREAGIEVHPRKNEARIGMDALLGIDSTDKLERFSVLAAEYGAAAEREACAKVCDHYATALDGGDNHYLRSAECRQAAAKIRARSTKP